jgi:hypothetical protein
VALAAGAGIALAAASILDPPPGGTVPVSSPSSPSPGTGTSGNSAPSATLPPLSGTGGRPVRQLMLVGRVTALSRTSITLSGQGQAVTAAITSRTRVTGRGSSVAAIKVGDTVSAQINDTGSPSVIAIQDPVSIP